MFSFFFSTFNFALKALFLFLDRKVTMLECNVIVTLFANYICLHGYIHFIYLFNPNTKCRDMYVYCKSAKKYRDINVLLILPSPTWKKCAFSNI